MVIVRRWVAVASVFLTVGSSTSTSALEFFSSRKSGTRGPEILLRRPGARLSALGGADVVFSDGSVVWGNPSALNGIDRSRAFFFHENGFSNERLDAASLARPVWWLGRRRTWGAGVTYLSQPPFDLRVDEETIGRANPYELAGTLAYAQPWGRGDVGLGVKYIRQQLYAVSARAFALDLGASAGGARWRAGGMLANLGTRLRGPGQAVALPFAVKGGAALRAARGRRGELWAGVQADAPADDRLTTHVGLEYFPPARGRWRWALRAGHQGNGAGAGPGVGFGMGRDGWELNYAFQADPDLGDAHRFDVSWRWGRPPAPEERRRTLLARAGDEIRDGRLLQARETLTELRALAPRDPDARGLRDDLERRFSESIDPQTLFLQGFHAFQENDLARAADIFEKLLVVSPQHPDARDYLTRCREALAATRAERLKNEVRLAREKEHAASAERARRAESEGRWEEALAAWRRARELSRDGTESRAGLARCRVEFRRRAEAAATAGDAAAARAAFQSALAAGDPDRALSESATHWARQDDERRRSRAQRAYAEGAEAYRAGDWVRARERFQEALTLSPEDAAVRRALERLNAEHPAP
jgi:tetratricopeptide (TPR) repeat protein